MSGLSDTPMKGGSNSPGSAGMLNVSLHQQFGNFHLDVEFCVALGLIVLFGASGAGKSLTLRGLSGLLHPKVGHVSIDGHLLFDSTAGINLPPQERRVGYVPQHYALFPHLTVAENVRFALPRRSQQAYTGRFLQERSQSGGGTEGYLSPRQGSRKGPLPLHPSITEGVLQERSQSGGGTEGYLSPRQGSRKGPHVFPQPPLPLHPSIRFGKIPPYVPWRKERAIQQARVAELLTALGLEGLERRYPATLSGGQQQRVALARALAAEPCLLLLDEPFNALDVAVRERLRDTLKQFQRKFAVPIVLVTHDHAEAQQLADTIVVLQRGQVVQVGSTQEIFLGPRTPDIALLVGQRNVFRTHLATPAGEQSSAPPKAFRVDWLQANGIEESVDGLPGSSQDRAWLPLPTTPSFPSPPAERTFTGCILADEVLVHRWSETTISPPTWTVRGAVQWKGILLDAQLHGHSVRLLIRPQWAEQPRNDTYIRDSILELYLNRGRWREIEVAPGQPLLLEIGPEAIHLFEV